MVAVVAVVVLGLVAVEAFAVTFTDRTLLLDADAALSYAGRTSWSSVAVLVTAVVLGVVGLLVLLAAVLPPRRRLVELAGADPALAIGVTPASLRRTLAAAVRVDGIDHATATLGRRRVVVEATTALRGKPALPRRVEDLVTERLRALRPERPLEVRVRVRRTDR